MLAERFVELAKAVGQDIVREDLVQAFVQLLAARQVDLGIHIDPVRRRDLH